MLQFFSRIFRIYFRVVFAALFVLAFANTGYAQSLGDPIVSITFGSGSSQFAGPLKPDSGSTTYGYIAASPDDNFYTIANTTNGLNRGWVLTTDHTGDPNGYMMIVNASFIPGEFYKRKVPQLCGNTTYQFSAFIKNIISRPGRILPNVTFSIEALDGTVLGSGNTNDITQLGVWTDYAFTFSTPIDADAVIIKMVNNAPGGGGNDIAIDDIVFRPYGAPLRVTSDQANATYCEGVSHPVTINASTATPAGNSQKVQLLKNRAWVDQTPASTATSFTVMSPTEPGSYAYRLVTASLANINTPSCIVASNTFDVKVLPLPTADFSMPKATCQNEPILFTDQSTAGDAIIATWLWDFGDGQTSTEQSPAHIYNASGDYKVKLTVTNNFGCVPSSTTRDIHVYKSVDIAFSYSTPDCVTKAITITDASVSTDGFILARVWDFGDGSPKETRNGFPPTPFQHTYATAGTYKLTLTINTDRGCTSVLTKDIVVGPLPVVNFGLPAVCLADSYAKFTDSTTIADNSGGLTYLWDFGDSNANAGNPNTSALQNPTHKYIEAKLYQVTLTVTSNSGCQTTITKPFTVNGSVPVANFNVLNSTALCSDRKVFFSNESTVDAGKITKVMWFFDTADMSVNQTDDNPYPGKLYSHSYPQFSSPATRNYQVRMLAYSGGICVDQKDVTITLNAAPTLTFNAPDSVCLNNGSMQFTGQENSGIAGTGRYTGRGVTASGLFDPAIAGVGSDTIRYIFTAATTCTDTIKRVIIVKPIPTVYAGADVTILSGATTQLHAIATGDNLTYKWLPETGLSNSTIPDPVASPAINTTYTLTVTNSEGCSVSGDVTVLALQVPIVPNAFTPNHDGVNDKWDIKYLDSYPGCTVDVFNRSGQKVFSSIGYKIAWDGQTNNGDLPFGVYYYIINPKNGRRATSGYVTIIR